MVELPTIDSNVQLVNQCVIIVRLKDISVESAGLKRNQERRQGMLLQCTLLPQIASLWRSIGGSHRWATGDLSAGGYRPRIFNFNEIKDNIINKPLKNYIILKCTINYNYLRHTIYSNMILLFKSLIFKNKYLWCLNNFYI